MMGIDVNFLIAYLKVFKGIDLLKEEKEKRVYSPLEAPEIETLNGFEQRTNNYIKNEYRAPFTQKVKNRKTLPRNECY